MSTNDEDFNPVTSYFLGIPFLAVGTISMLVKYPSRNKRLEVLKDHYKNSYKYAGYSILVKAPLWVVVVGTLTVAAISFTILYLTGNLPF